MGLILGENFLWWEFSGWELSGWNHLGGNFPGAGFHVTFIETIIEEIVNLSFMRVCSFVFFL